MFPLQRLGAPSSSRGSPLSSGLPKPTLIQPRSPHPTQVFRLPDFRASVFIDPRAAGSIRPQLSGEPELGSFRVFGALQSRSPDPFYDWGQGWVRAGKGKGN